MEEYQNNIALKLNDPMTTTKTYWSILKAFYNGKKVPIIPPINEWIPLINDRLILDIEVKANHFNNFLHFNVHLYKIVVKSPKIKLT